MKSEGEIRDFYDFSLSELLKELDEKRWPLALKLFSFYFLTTFTIILLFYFLVIILNMMFLFIISMIAAVAGAAVLYYFRIKKSLDEFTAEFKKTIIGKIVGSIDKSLKYDPSSFVPEKSFMESRMFLRSLDSYHGEDHVSGKIGDINLEFSEIHAEYKTGTSSGNSGSRTSWNTVFKGIFFIADFNTAFSGTTVVIPDFAEKVLGRLGVMLQSFMPVRQGKIIRFEDPEFEKEFVVYTDDNEQASQILTPALRRKILDFNMEAVKKTKHLVYLSFRNSKVYVGISTDKNLFEPRIFLSNNSMSLIRKYYEMIDLATSIVRDLGLNSSRQNIAKH